MPKADKKTSRLTSDDEEEQKEQNEPGGDSDPSKAWALAQALKTCSTGEDISWHDSLCKAVSIA